MTPWLDMLPCRTSLYGLCRRILHREFHNSLPTARSTKARAQYGMAKVKSTVRDTLMQQGFRSPQMPPAIRSRDIKLHNNARISPIKPPSILGPGDVQYFLRDKLSTWLEDPKTLKRLTLLGIPTDEAKIILRVFGSEMAKELEIPRRYTREEEQGDPWSVKHLWWGPGSDRRPIIDRALTMRLFAFAANPRLEIQGVSLGSLETFQEVYKALDMRFPSEQYTLARSQKRKIFLHVGPTNSGKTYNALRALADARSGVYAGPLRLLAHEVWERLNRGSIRPFDADPSTAADYARPCNLITGEEHRIVDMHARLTSCTVEMIHLNKRFDVCVIDEIQMIADSQRGSAWTTAVLGVAADELHLCGEESAIPIIRRLVAETDDELEIKQYTRLTPLAVAEKSLEGQWSRIEKGDCVVTFSRRSIFHLKAVVEEATGLRCAVVYGRLPPETRSEQAALFNDRDSGYDVIIASDAIGMGLNLKIKRIVFVQLMKNNGIKEVPLSVSQIKQIGGRAGRFGEHADGSVGIVTTFEEGDLSSLKKVFQMDAPALSKAVVPYSFEAHARVAELLPATCGLREIKELIEVGARVGSSYTLMHDPNQVEGLNIIDRRGKNLLILEKIQFLMAPLAWKSDIEVPVFDSYLRQYVLGQVVDVEECVGPTGLLDIMERVQMARNCKSGGRLDDIQNMETLGTLETLHRVLITYIWLSFRMPVSFSQQKKATQMKEEVERCIEFVLEGIKNITANKPVKTADQMRQEVASSRITYQPKQPRLPKHLWRAQNYTATISQ